MNGTKLRRLLPPLCFRTYCYKSVRRPDLSTNRKLTAPQSQEEDVERRRNDMTKQIRAKILTSGPITVADYMREVLTSPTAGYYMNRDVFGKEGDFITSPEISQIFGELVAVWLLMEWRKLGSPAFQLVELGPGRGTLSRDVLRVLSQFQLSGQFSMHLVEISPHLSKIQAQRFCFEHKLVTDEACPYYQVGETATGTKAFWYKRLEDVPREFSIVLAHEFFDAMPVHKLQMIDGVWKEILIDLNDPEKGEEVPFRFVISNSQTPVSKLYKAFPGDGRQCLEYSLETDRIVGMLCERMQRDGGISLIMDYGHNGEKTDTFRAFRKHKLHDPLVDPGTADLTADVDFRQMKRAAEQDGKVICFGPIEQGTFLKRMEGDARLEQLLLNALPENHHFIKSGYEMLTSPDQMGQRFKFFSMFPAVMREHLEKYPVQGFNSDVK